MRWQAVIVLTAIALSIVIPPTLILTGVHGVQTAIGTLDVCHSATPALSSNGNMPCLDVCSNHPLPLALQGVTQIAALQDKSVIIAVQDEHPPQLLA